MRVFLDSCVILSKLPREIMFELSRQNLLSLHYSKSVQAEVEHVARRKNILPDLMAAFVSLRLLTEPVQACDMENLWLPDDDDLHVLNGAIASKSDILLTENLRDFPKPALHPHGLRALSPDQLIGELWAKYGDQIEEIVVGIDGVSKNALKNAKLYKLAKRLSEKMIRE